MTNRLPRSEVAGYLERLKPRLTAMQATRLAVICDLVGADGRFHLREALEVAEFPQGDTRAQDAFQDFRQRVNATAEKAGVDLQLQLDSRKTSPDNRYGWFTGGDLVEEGLVAFTEQAAGHMGIARPVSPEVAELGTSQRTRVYVSFYPSTGNSAKRAHALVEQLATMLAADTERSWEVKDPRSVGLGEDISQARDRLSAEADVRVVLVSPTYLDRSDGVHAEERRRVFGHSGPIVAFALSGLPEGAVNLSPLERHDVRQQDKPWDELTNTSQRKAYIKELVGALQRALRRVSVPVDEETGDELMLHWVTKMAHSQRGYDSQHVVPSEVAETTLQESQLGSVGRAAGPPLHAVDRLLGWATDNSADAPRLCALLGDVGMGKTTTVKLFTRHLLELREKTNTAPLPILFDLRDVNVSALADSMTLGKILTGMLDATRPAGVPTERLNAEVVRKRLAKGDVVVVFDGLDEVLVHLSPHERQLFTRQLWRVMNDAPAARMLLTCRTQYFCTIRDEVTYFTGETRHGLHGSDYLALLMLPFRGSQIREYLAVNLNRDANWVNGFLETIAAVHDLPDLARRPITLRLIADQVEFIETAKLEGRTLQSVDIYAEVVERWISRDEGKHTLIPDHKRLLMEEIAAALWRSGKSSWGSAEVDNWLLELLDRRADLQRHYRDHVPDLWKADFRTATFLKREENRFEFGHRSLFEYFLANYLFRTLAESDLQKRVGRALALPVPSRETFDFFGQLIAGATEERRSLVIGNLRRIGERYYPKISELVFSYALHADRGGYPYQSLINVQMQGAQLSDLRVERSERVAMLPIMGANFAGADLRRAMLKNVDLSEVNLTNANLGNAEFHHVKLVNSVWHNALLNGTIFRDCEIGGVTFRDAKKYRAQLLNCMPPMRSDKGLLIAPQARVPQVDSRPTQLVPLTGHTGPIQGVAWSPDGARILSGGFDGVRVWDAATGEPLRHFPARGAVKGVAWSPDGARILSGGFDGVRVWDAATGEPLHRLAGRSGAVQAVAWSPDGARIVASGRVWDAASGEPLHRLAGCNSAVQAVAWSPDGARIVASGRVWDAASGKLLHRLAGRSGAVHAVAWSPDGTRILTGSRDGARVGSRVWDAASGELLQHLAGRSDPVDAVAWSPDGTQILTGGPDGVRVWDAADGKPLHRLASHSNPVQAVAWSPDGTRILAGSYEDVRVWDAADGKTLHRLAAHSNPVQAVAWSPDGTRIVAGSRVWDAADGKPLHRVADHGNPVQAVAWSPDGTRILTGSRDGVRVWDAADGKTLHRVADHGNPVQAVAWSPDGTRILAGSGDDVRVWDAADGKPLHRLAGRNNPVQAVAWSPDGTRILTGGHDNTIRVWDAGTGEPVHGFTVDSGPVHAVAWSPDSARLIAGSGAGVRVWDADTGEPVHGLTVYKDPVQAVAWSPDGTRILTGGHDNTIRVWDAGTGEPLHHFVGHTDWVRAVRCSADNTRILTSSYDNTICAWDADSGRPVGIRIVLLPNDGHAVFDAESGELTACTEDAWRWLGWLTMTDSRMDRLPAETFGPLPVW